MEILCDSHKGKVLFVRRANNRAQPRCRILWLLYSASFGTKDECEDTNIWYGFCTFCGTESKADFMQGMSRPFRCWRRAWMILWIFAMSCLISSYKHRRSSPRTRERIGSTGDKLYDPNTCRSGHGPRLQARHCTCRFIMVAVS